MAGIRIYDDTFVDAAALLERALVDAEHNPPLLVQTLMSLAFAQGMAGQFEASLRNARDAVTHAEAMRYPPLVSRALAMLVNTTFLYGHGIDEASLQRALALEDPDVDVPIPFCASAVNALVLAWTGQLDEARSGDGRRSLALYRARCRERHDGSHRVLHPDRDLAGQFRRGRGAGRRHHGTRRGGRWVPHDRADGARRGAHLCRARTTSPHRAAAALAIAHECESPRLAEWPTMSLGLLEVSLGRYAEVLTALQPMLDVFDDLPGAEIMTATFIPDAVEAMVALGRHTEAEPLIEVLEHHGRRLDRSWMLAVGARCRSMWLAARGDVVAAMRIAEHAMVVHARLPMPFERARTQLLLGQLQRRQRQKDASSNTFREALRAFDAMGAALWVDRTRAELARAKVARRRDVVGLTPSEQRVAELAASGMTNRDVAAALFISPKTVEANLARIYRKLGIKSRAELGRVIGDL